MLEVPLRAEFISDVDDVADAGMRYLRHSEAGRAARRKEIRRSTAISAIAFFLAVMFVADWPSGIGVLLAAGLAVVWGLIFWWGYSRVYEGYVLRRLRAFAQEQLGTRESFHCVIELRPEGAWSRQNDAEVLLPWRDAVGIRDSEGGIELHFRSGFMMARNRAFASPAGRVAFLQRARELAKLP